MGAAACLAACTRGVSAPAKPAPTAAAAVPSGLHSPPVPRTTAAAVKPAGVPAAHAAHRTAAVAHRTARPAARHPIPAPEILAASVSPTVVGSGTVVSAVVRTTPGVVSVVASAAGVTMSVPRVGPGVFEGSTTLPALPPFARGSYAVTFIASDARGARTQAAVGVVVR